MVDTLSPAQRRRAMQAVKGKDTKPEWALRRRLHARGFRYRLHDPRLPGKPDLVLPRRRTAIFVHGCFWHGHDCPRGSRRPATNQAYWEAKIARNRARDQAAEERLKAMGYRVLIVWECELKDPDAAAERVATALAE
ncbi:MAG: very short patch repair endonuclease [Marivibrio sp.]|uniref:very short patch repair endonuclease n=1 Tax=Marivibrio sp. TaxID=2039719 RepID=UPI0032EE30AB